MNTAIIVAAGSSSRFGSEQPKQFVKILGKPLIIHTLEKFQACPAVDEIVLVLSEDSIAEFEISDLRSEIGKLKAVVAGGASRAESVKNGLDAVDVETKIIAIHDGARPLVSVDEISATITKANEIGAACLVGAVTDTIKTIRGDEISGTLDRDKLRRAFTPQAFKIEVLRSAFALGDISEAVTDECYLVERLGHPIAFVEGNSRNIKITRQEDLIIAKAFLSEPLA